MVELEARDTWLSYDIHQLEQNITYVTKTAQSKTIWAVVKADSYGHGMKALLPTFIKKGIDHFCVVYFDEAVELQKQADKQGAKIEVLILGDTPVEKIPYIQKNWAITIASKAYLERFLAHIGMQPIKVHLKIDSGMNRRGFKIKQDFQQAFESLKIKEHVTIEGVYTHLATADNDPNENFKLEQIQQFEMMAAPCFPNVKYVHVQNSHGLMTLPSDTTTHFNSVRLGAILYGLSVERPEVKPIAALFSKIIEVKKIKKGEYVSYGIRFKAPADGYIAVLPIGYADGLWRSSRGYNVYINKQLYPIVGTICMEQCMVYTTDSTAFNVGDTAEFFGKHRSIEQLARHNDTIDYEIMCTLSPRITRKYESITCEKER